MLVLPLQEDATRLFLIRHLEPDESMAGRAHGALDVPLAPPARERAERLGHALEHIPLAAVYASPLRRALETAIPIAARQGLVPVTHDGLRELDFGEFEGQPYDELERRSPEIFREWMTDPTNVVFPGGEAFTDLRRRALAAAEEIRARHAGGSAAVVAHGGVTRAILAAALGMPDGALFRLDQAYGAVSVVDWFGTTPVVRLLNAELIRSSEERA
jgi:alpha-ribazole phosphatase